MDRWLGSSRQMGENSNSPHRNNNKGDSTIKPVAASAVSSSREQVAFRVKVLMISSSVSGTPFTCALVPPWSVESRCGKCVIDRAKAITYQTQMSVWYYILHLCRYNTTCRACKTGTSILADTVCDRFPSTFPTYQMVGGQYQSGSHQNYRYQLCRWRF